MLCDFGKVIPSWYHHKFSLEDLKRPGVQVLFGGSEEEDLNSHSALPLQFNSRAQWECSYRSFHLIKFPTKGHLLFSVFAGTCYTHWSTTTLSRFIHLPIIKGMSMFLGSAVNNIVIIIIYWLDALFCMLWMPYSSELLESCWLPLLKSLSLFLSVVTIPIMSNSFPISWTWEIDYFTTRSSKLLQVHPPFNNTALLWGVRHFTCTFSFNLLNILTRILTVSFHCVDKNIEHTEFACLF